MLLRTKRHEKYFSVIREFFVALGFSNAWSSTGFDLWTRNNSSLDPPHFQLPFATKNNNLEVQHLGPDAMEGCQAVGSRVMRKPHLVADGSSSSPWPPPVASLLGVACAWSGLCRVSGAGLDPQRGVDAERRPHHGQLAAGGRAAAEGARAVPACHRGRRAWPAPGQGCRIPSRGSPGPGNQNGVQHHPQMAVLANVQFLIRGGNSLANAVR